MRPVYGGALHLVNRPRRFWPGWLASVGSNLARRAVPFGCLTRGSRLCISDVIHAGGECSHLLGKQLLLALLRGQLPLEIAGLVCGALRGSLEISNRLLERRQRLL